MISEEIFFRKKINEINREKRNKKRVPRVQYKKNVSKNLLLNLIPKDNKNGKERKEKQVLNVAADIKNIFILSL